MTIAEQGQRLRAEILRMRIGQARRYEAAQRHRILDWVDRAGRSGVSERECAHQLGIPQARFAYWRARHASEQEPQLVPVEIRESESHAIASYAIVSPSGFRVEGLTIDQTVALLRALA
jgi:hypothetical protein